MMTLPPRILRDYVVNDFEKAWNAMAAADFDLNVGGNFMFARQAMVLLELASRVASQDETLLEAFGSELSRIQPLYFTPLRGAEARLPRAFSLPSTNVGPAQSQLLAVLFDLVRNGQMHYGEQIAVNLGDGTVLGVALGGVVKGRTVDQLSHPPRARPLDHLAFNKRAAGHFELWVSSGVLFIDVRDAADCAGVFDSGLTLLPFKRSWAATSAEIEDAIRVTPHLLFEERPGNGEKSVRPPMQERLAGDGSVG